MELSNLLKKSQEENQLLMQTLRLQKSGTILSQSLSSDLQSKFKEQIQMLIDENNKIKDNYLAKRQYLAELERKAQTLEEYSNS